MMCRRSLSRPGFGGFPAASHASRDCPPFHARVVKPRISTLTPHRSSVRARISAQVAATVIGRPRIEPELSKDRKSTRLNSSHVEISYAVFCLKKKKKKKQQKQKLQKR